MWVVKASLKSRELHQEKNITQKSSFQKWETNDLCRKGPYDIQHSQLTILTLGIKTASVSSWINRAFKLSWHRKKDLTKHEHIGDKMQRL